jgi:uncharacterized protein (TIRG00374 family)
LKKINPKIILILFLSVGVYGVLIFYFDAQMISWNALYHLKKFIIFSLMLVCINYIIRFVRWQWCLYQKNIMVPWKFSLLIFLSGFVMSITPGKLGETFKSMLLYQKFQIPLTSSLPVVLIERISDVLGLMILILLGIFSYPEFRGWTIAVCTTMGLFLYVIQSPVFFKFFIKFLEKTKFRKYSHPLQTFWSNISFFIHWKRLLPLALGSSISWCLEGVAVWCLAVGIVAGSPSLESSVFVYSMTTLAGALSFLPGGVGVTEAGMVSLFQWFHVVETQSQASLLTLLTRLFTLWWGVAIGCISWFVMGLTLKSLPQASQKSEPAPHQDST